MKRILTPFQCSLCLASGDVYGTKTVCLNCERGFQIKQGGAVVILDVTWDSEE